MPIVAARTRVIGALKFKVIISAPCAPKIDLIEHRTRPRSLFDPCLGGCPLQDCERERERAGGVAWSAHGTVSDAGQCAPRQPSKQKRVKESLSTDSRLLLGLLCAVCERQRGAGHAIGGWCVATKIVSGGAVVDAYGCSGRRAPAPASACC